MRVARILIVEDDYSTADYMNLVLSTHGYNVICIVETGEDAITKTLGTRPDLIIMDIKLMGRMDGITTYKQIKKSVNIPIIFVSAYGDDNTIDRAMQCNPNGYLVKPFRMFQLINEVETALEKQDLHDSREVQHAFSKQLPISR